MAGLYFRGVQGFHDSRRSPPTPVLGREQGVRQALFGTLPGGAIVVGLAMKLLVVGVGAVTGRVPVFVSVVDTVAGIAIAAGALYFLFRLLVLAKQRLLWRVRRKLILSYIFIGLIPAILIAAFFLLCGLLLFYNFSSYLVQSRVHAIEDQGRLVAQSTALEIQRASGRDLGAVVRRKQEDASREFPGASMAVVFVSRPCGQTGPGPADGTAAALRPPVIAGPWAHVEPPRTLPGWVGCSGFSGLLAYSHATLRPFDMPGVAPSKVEGRQAEGGPGSRAQSARAPIVVDGQSVDLSGSVEDTHMFVRAAAFPDSPTPDYAVVVDLLVNNVDHRIGPRAVHGHRARAPRRLHAQDRGEGAGSTRGAGRVVQLDDREH